MPRFEQRLTTLEWVCMQASRLPARLSTDPASSHQVTQEGKRCQELRAFHGVRLDAIQRVLVLHVESQSIVGSYPFFAGLCFPMQTGQGE
jgi:hypothetical protein